MPIARQRLGKHASTIERLFSMWSAPRPLLCNGAVNTPKTIRDNRRLFSMGSVQSSYKEEFNWAIEKRLDSRVSGRQPAGLWAWEQRNWIESSLRNWQLQNNGKKGIGLRKEDFMCDLKLQWDFYKYVAWLRLVKTENPSACVAVNCEVRGNSDSAVTACSLEFWMYKVSINPINQSKTRLISHALQHVTIFIWVYIIILPCACEDEYVIWKILISRFKI
jgi:hypothetical protein